MLFGIAFSACIFAVGGILFHHFEEKTPKWRRILKFFIITSLFALAGEFTGPAGVIVLFVMFLIPLIFIHAWWLPKKYGINGWTAEPKEKYYELRGWK
jgi:hypothetical protein